MKMTERLVLTWACLLFVVAIGYLLSPLVPWRRVLNHQGLAAWVQAFGSIGAILATMAVVYMQATATRRIDSIRRTEEDLRRIKAIKALLSVVSTTIRLLNDSWEKKVAWEWDRRHLDSLLASKRAFEALPVFEIPDSELATRLVVLPRALETLHKAWSKASEDWRGGVHVEASTSQLGNELNDAFAVVGDAGANCERLILAASARGR